MQKVFSSGMDMDDLPCLRPYLLAAGLCWLFFLIPFVSVVFAPIVDLPQQVHQIKLWLQYNPRSDEYVVFWWYPNHLSYLFLRMGWFVAGPLGAGRIGMWFLSAFWLFSFFLLGWRLAKAPWMLVLASFLFFNSSMYWGFYSFLTGQAALFLLLAWWFSPVKSSPRHQFFYGLCFSLLLYFSHVFVWGVAVVCMVVLFLLSWRDWRISSVRLLGYLSLTPLVFVWFFHYQKIMADQSLPTVWKIPLLVRLTPAFFFYHTGGLQGGIEETYLVFLLVLFIVFAFSLSFKKSERSSAAFGFPIFALFLLFLSFFLFFPTTHRQTFLFAERWHVLVVVFFLFVWRSPINRHIGLLGGALICLFGVLLFTANQWRKIEKQDFSGLASAASRLPDRSRLLALDTRSISSHLKLSRSFLNTFAYAAILEKDVRLFTSFADHYSSLVVHNPFLPKNRARRKQVLWLSEANWLPLQFFQRRHVHSFSHILVLAEPDMHEFVRFRYQLDPLTTQGLWRLYRPQKPLSQSAASLPTSPPASRHSTTKP